MIVKARNEAERRMLDQAKELQQTIEQGLLTRHQIHDELGKIRRLARQNAMLSGPDGAKYRDFLEHIGAIKKR